MRLITPLAIAATILVAPSLAAQVIYGGSGRLGRAVAARASDNRAVLGITTSSGGARDTLGLLVSSVTRGGPADSAGIEEGNRLVAVNGVNLRLSASDAGEPDMAGVLGRRLQRELEKVTAGDQVELRVWADGQVKTLRVKTVRADALQANNSTIRARVDDRPTIGASVGGAPSARDTLGVFVVAVSEDGPLAKAGIYEGARIASINGMDLRVPVADVGDEFMTGARIRRFNREVEELQPGANAELRVWVNGQYRTVTVQAVKRSDLKDAHSITIFRSGGSSLYVPGGAIDGFFHLQRDLPETIRRSLEEAQTAAERALSGLRDRTIYREFDRDQSLSETLRRLEEQARDGDSALETRARIEALEAMLRARGAGETAAASTATFSFAPAVMSSADPLGGAKSQVFSVAGVRFGPVDEQLASYLGRGSDRGLLVLDVDARWSGIRAGDVLLSIDGRPVRGEDRSTWVSLRAPGEYKVELVRNGQRVTEVIRAH